MDFIGREVVGPYEEALWLCRLKYSMGSAGKVAVRGHQSGGGGTATPSASSQAATLPRLPGGQSPPAPTDTLPGLAASPVSGSRAHARLPGLAVLVLGAREGADPGP